MDNLILAGAAGAEQGQGSSLMTFLPMILIFLIIYFLMIRPQMKKQKEHAEMVQKLKVGDTIVTNSGIVGKIANITSKQFGDKKVEILKIKTAKETDLEVLRDSISMVESAKE